MSRIFRKLWLWSHAILIVFLVIALALYVIGQLVLRLFCPRLRLSSTRCQINTCVAFFAEPLIIMRRSWAKSHTHCFVARNVACIDQALLLDLLQGFPIVGPVQQSRRWSEFLPVDALSSRAWEFSDLVITPRRSGRPRSRTCKKAHVLGLCSRSRK